MTKRVRPLASFPFDVDLLKGLARLAKIEHTAQAVILRRALRRELEEQGILKPAGRTYGPSGRAAGRGTYFTTKREAEAFAKEHPGADVRRSGRRYVVVLADFQGAHE